MAWAPGSAFIAIGVLASSYFAGDPPKRPPCNFENVGRFWPPRDRSDRNQTWHLVQTGQLKVCAENGWHYRWQSLTVDFKELTDAARKRQRQSP